MIVADDVSAMTTDTCPAWDPALCEGTPECPPRCPRFIDRHGESVLVVPSSPSHLEGLVSLYDGYPTTHRSMGLPPIGRSYIEDWLEHQVERGVVLVAVHDGQPIGHAAYVPRSSPEPHFVVFLDPDYHNRGIGNELCRHVIARAADAGHEALVLDVDPTNERAISLYRRLGFETVERNTGELRMRLSFDEPIVETVQLPPAERPANA